MNKINQWLAKAALGIALLSTGTIAKTPIESFLERIQSQPFNTQVMTVGTTEAPTIQMYMGKPSDTINIDPLNLFNLPDFQIELPGLNNLFAIKENVTNNNFGGLNWVGDVYYLDPNGFNSGVQGRAYFIENNGAITGAIHTPEEVIQIFPDGAGGQITIRSLPSEFAVEDDAIVAASGDHSHHEHEVAGAPPVGGRLDGESPATLDNPYTIDVMFVIPTTTQSQVTDIEALTELAITSSNDVFANSLIPVRFRTVEIVNTNYSEPDDNPHRSLSHLQDTDDGHMDEIHAIRENVGADLVMIVSDVNGPVGVGYLDARRDFAFTLTKYSAMGGYTPIHEFGHNFGAHHDHDNAYNGYYSFGYGIKNGDVDPYWRTVMSYGCVGRTCSAIPYFSAPELTYNDMPLGDPETMDNARVVRIRAAEVAGFYPSTVPHCSDYTATNDQHVSAGRAYTESSGGFFPTTTYYAVGSNDNLGTSGFTSNTLLESPVGYYALGDCSTSTATEPAFAPEVQNLAIDFQQNIMTVSGEVFDANGDDISAVEVRIEGSTTWALSTLGDNTFSASVPNVSSGEVVIQIRTTDVTGRSFTFSLNSTDVPAVTYVEVDSNGPTATVSVIARDLNNDITQLRINLDNANVFHYDNSNNNIWEVTLPDLTLGSHTIEVSVTDAAGNSSAVETRSFEITPAQQTCFRSTNDEHVAAGRARVQVRNQTCFGTFCFGGTTHYLANGTNRDLGNSGTSITTLEQVNDGVFTISECTVVDLTPPVITLNGTSPMSVALDSQFVDPGANATDDNDGDISSNIVVTGTVNTAILGTYTLRYNVSDAAGNPAQEAIRTVNVVEGNSCYESTLSAHSSAGRAYEQYSLYYATGTATYLGSTYTDANKVVALEESSPGNWSQVTSCN